MRSYFEQVLAGEPGKMMVLEQKPFMFAAVNDGGRAALYIRVSLPPQSIVSDGEGFSVRVTRVGSDEYVRILSEGKDVPTLFVKLSEYVVERVSAESESKAGGTTLIQAIKEFRDFVNLKRGKLSEETVRGTFAELLFLDILLSQGISAAEAVAAWRGPWSRAGIGLHDFTFPTGRGIEIKSTRLPAKAVRVSSPAQLLPGTEQLDLLVLPIENATGQSDTVVEFRRFASEIGERIAMADPNAFNAWADALKALGLDLDDTSYDSYRFMPSTWHRYEVREGFPHLPLSSIPAGLSEVRYSIELHYLTPFTRSFDELLEELTPA